jgi:hypothetical protein
MTMSDQNVLSGNYRAMYDAEGAERTYDVTVELDVPGTDTVPFTTKVYLFGCDVFTVNDGAGSEGGEVSMCRHDSLMDAHQHMDDVVNRLADIISDCPIPVLATVINEHGDVTTYHSPAQYAADMADLSGTARLLAQMGMTV